MTYAMEIPSMRGIISEDISRNLRFFHQIESSKSLHPLIPF